MSGFLKSWRRLFLGGAVAWLLAFRAMAQPSLQQLLNDFELGDHWIYDDYARALAQARETGRPLLVLFR